MREDLSITEILHFRISSLINEGDRKQMSGVRSCHLIPTCNSWKILGALHCPHNKEYV